MTSSNNKDSHSSSEKKILPSINRKTSQFSSNFERIIKNLSQPRFLGSIHLKNQEISTKNNSINNLIDNELDLKISKSLRNTLFNPLTKILIIAAILFNLLWFLSIYFF